tara:strand:- start:213 stop:737 length:525 start_codon:yes stop_codon:yes gene_type:complete
MSDFDKIDFSDVNFDTLESRTGESEPFIPKGDYNCVVMTCTKHVSAAGNNSIKLEVKVHNEPKFNGWIVRKYFSLWHPNEEVAGYAKSDFSLFLKGLGLSRPPENAEDLQGKSLICTFSEKDNSDNDNPAYQATTNEIVAFRTPKDDGLAPPKKVDVPPSMAQEDSGESDKPSL